MRHTVKSGFRSPASNVQWTVVGAQTEVDKRKKQVRIKPNIDWVDAPKGTSMRRRQYPSMYCEPPNVDATIAAQFIIGRPVMASQALILSKNKGVYDFAPLEPFLGQEDEVHIPAGSLLIYTGEIHQIERMHINSKKHDVSAIKHTFITPLGRCIIHDFNLIKLIFEEETK